MATFASTMISTSSIAYPSGAKLIEQIDKSKENEEQRHERLKNWLETHRPKK